MYLRYVILETYKVIQGYTLHLSLVYHGHIVSQKPRVIQICVIRGFLVHTKIDLPFQKISKFVNIHYLFVEQSTKYTFIQKLY